jgi:putative peptide zinc metalloprotease protein
MQRSLTRQSEQGGDRLSPPPSSADVLLEQAGPSEGRHLIPPLVKDLRFVPGGSTARTGLLHRKSTGLVVRIGLVEWEVLRRFDGTGDAGHVCERVERECGVRVLREELERLARGAANIGLLERPEKHTVRRSRWRGLSWSIPLWNPDRVFSWCAPRTAVLFRPASIVIGGLVVVIAAVTFIEASPAATSPRLPTWSQAVTFLVLLNIVSIVHECGHGLALHRYGGHVREIGVRFVVGWPCWYCDITESYLLPCLRQRVSVLLAGPLFQAVACAVVILAAGGSDRRAVALRTVAAVLGALSILNFFPFVRSDGYYLLTELAGLPNLRRHAWHWISSSAARQRMRAGLPRVRRIVIATYAVASTAFVTLVLGRAVTVIGRVCVGAAHFSIGTLIAALGIAVVLTTVIRGRSFTP